jgi:cytochrome bd-type quinol oxidase subunit 2
MYKIIVMKDRENFILNPFGKEISLLPYQFRTVGLFVLIIGFPLAVAILGCLKMFNISPDQSWVLIIAHYPISIALILLNFSKEKQEDEMVQFIRSQSFVKAVRVFAIGLLLYPFISILSRSVQGKPVGIADLGGMLAVLNLLLTYTYILFRINLNQARKRMTSNEE